MHANGSSTEFHEEVRCLLGKRLRNAALILCGAFLGFLLRTFILGQHVEMGEWWVLAPHLATTVVLGAVAWMLTVKHCQTLQQLRILEVVVFLLPAAFFVWSQLHRLCHTPIEKIATTASAYPAEVTIPWMILMTLYSVFIPNTGRRAAAVVALMWLVPIIGTVAAAIRQPLLAEVLFDGGLSAMMLWLGITSVTTVYGSHRFGTLRRETFDAKRVGEYTLRQKLGAGGMGEVYLAEHQLLKRPCAIKLIRPEKAGDAAAIARFESEVQATARLTHPNTIEIYDYGHTQDGTFYYAMEFLPGLNMQDLVDRYGPLPAERVVHLLLQVCSALNEAHLRGLIHRDIKPGNIFVAERGQIFDFAKLLDFGLVKSIESTADSSVNLTIEGTVIGSPLYAAPERTMGEGTPDARSDIYSLGATAYFLLTGRPVFEGKNPLKVLFAHANDNVAAPSALGITIPADLEAVVLKCLTKSPDDRYQTVVELGEALSACQSAGQWSQASAAAWWSETDETTQHKTQSQTDEATITMVAEAVQ